MRPPSAAWILLPALLLGLPAAAAQPPGADRCTATATPQMQRCEAGLPRDLVAEIGQEQRASNWCWAATASMLLRRYGVSVRQDDIVRSWYGSAVNLGVGLDGLLAMLHRPWSDWRGRAVQPRVVGLDSAQADIGRLDPDLLLDLQHGRPLLLGAHGHAMLLVKVVYQQHASGVRRLLEAVVFDPALGQGLRTLRADELRPRFLARVLVAEPPELVADASAQP